MQNFLKEEYLNQVIQILEKTGLILLDYLSKEIIHYTKDDNTPVTDADITANNYICSQLKILDPLISIISEENKLSENLLASENNEFWLLDPLDGTKSFIKKDTEFAICLARIKDHRPEFGFIHIPFSKETFFNNKGKAYVKKANGDIEEIKTNKKKKNLIVVSSRRMKKNKKFKEYLKTLPIKENKIISSAIKFCEIAQGTAQISAYFADTMQWDTAAGDAIIHAAGGEISDISGKKLLYGNFNNFVNPHFTVNA